jgi:hypothetical protein
MKISKIKSALIKANRAEERCFKAESELFLECQKLCNYPLNFCQYQPSDGFCLVFDTDKVKDVDISVKSFIDLVSKLKRKLELEDIISTF